MDTDIYTYARAKQAQEIFSEQQIDNLLDLIYDKSLSRSEKDAVLRALLPDREKNFAHYEKQSNDKLVTPEFVQQYANYRALGLPVKDAARLCGITLRRMNSLLSGVGLSVAQHEMILQAEQEALARFKKANLTVMHNAAQEGKWTAAQALLEKVLPDEYGKRMEVHNSGAIRLSNDECEAMAQKAAEDLRKLREARKQEISIESAGEANVQA